MNTTPSTDLSPTASGESRLEISTEDTLLVFAFTLIVVVGCTGNLLVLYVFAYKRRFKVKSSTEYLIVYLAIIDLLSSLINPSRYIYSTVFRGVWHLGWVGCKIVPVLGAVTTTSSSAFLLVFAIDRYIAITSPFHGHLSRRKLNCACACALLVSFLSYVHYCYFLNLGPYLSSKAGNNSTNTSNTTMKPLLYNSTNSPNTSNAMIKPPLYCNQGGTEDTSYSIPNCVLVFLRLLTFAFVFLFTNYRIYVKLKSNEILPSDHRTERTLQSRSIMRVLITMGVVFIVLVYPKQLLNLSYTLSWLVQTDNGINYPLAIKLNRWLTVMRTSNSCANIFIYAHMQSRFRRYILRVFYNVGCCTTSYLRTSMYSISQVSPSTRSRLVSRFSIAKRGRLSYTRSSVHSSPLLKARRDSKRRGECPYTSSPIFFKRAQAWKQLSMLNGGMIVTMNGDCSSKADYSNDYLSSLC